MRNNWGIAGGQVEIFRVALKVPFITALGSRSETVNVGIRLQLNNGATGYGEAAGSVVNARLRPPVIARVLRQELKRAAGHDARRLKLLVSGVHQRNLDCAPAAAAFECALTEALARAFGLRLCDWFGGTQETLETDITLSAGTPEAATIAARRASQEGFSIFKVKVGTGPEQDLPRALAVWETVRKGAHRPSLLLDGNQGLTPKQALVLVEQCLRRKVRVLLFEQPVVREDLKGLAWLQRRSPVPIAADESVRSAQDARRLLDLDAVDVFNLKVAKTGLQESLEIVSLVKSAGKKLMIGCMQESARGLSASMHLACGTGVFKFVDLDSDHLLVAEQPAGDFKRDGPRIRLARPRDR